MSESFQFLTEVHKFENLPDEEIPEIIFWGRSNVGKSSLINALTKSKIAKTSNTPGRTRSLIFFELKGIIRFVDFPGYGYSKIPKENELKIDYLIDQYLKKRQNLNQLFLLIDSRRGLKEIDKIIINQLDSFIRSKITIIFTKVDRLKNKEEKNLLKKHNDFIGENFNKNFFNTSIKETNTIILLKKSVVKHYKKCKGP